VYDGKRIDIPQLMIEFEALFRSQEKAPVYLILTAKTAEGMLPF
jgi:hypothetical protein